MINPLLIIFILFSLFRPFVNTDEGVDHIEIAQPNKENDNTIKDITDTAQPDYLL